MPAANDSGLQQANRREDWRRLRMTMPSQQWMDAFADAAGALLPPRRGPAHVGRGPQGHCGLLRAWQLRVIAWAFWRWRYRPSTGARARFAHGGGRLRWDAVRAAMRAATEGASCGWRRAVGAGRRRVLSRRQAARARVWRQRCAAAARKRRLERRQTQQHKLAALGT
jgi:hypothetical protein